MKPQCIVRAMVLTTIFLFTAHADAAPVNLYCRETGAVRATRQVTFDKSLGTAFFGTDAPSAASFSETNIKWSGTFDADPNSPEAFRASFVLDRVTGVLAVHYVEYMDYLYKAEFQCAVSAIKF
jgi:hypothetical protein